MCGISGIISKENIDSNKYYCAHSLLKHRGPDDEGFFYSNNRGVYGFARGNDTCSDFDQVAIQEIIGAKVIIGHRRLSIFDLSTAGHQPMRFDNLVLTYNGEIFNYLELREELIDKGYVFESNTDTEVFLKAFHLWGVDAFNKFNGMWAAAIYDIESKKLFLTRDRYGIKPLFFNISNDFFCFGSEVKFVAKFVPDALLNNSIAFDYIRYGLIDHTNKTFIEGIESLDPGHYLINDGNQISTRRYYKLKKSDNDEIEYLVKNSISLRMAADVEVGALLSGGIDSTSIVCLIKEQSLANNLRTFTIDFDDKEFSERPFVENTLEKTGFHGEFIKIDSNKIEKILDDALLTRESPFRSMSVMSQYSLFEHIYNTTNVKVILSGEGADEVFTGYTNDLYVFLLSLLQSFKFQKFKCEIRHISLRLNRSIIRIVFDLIIRFGKDFLRLNKFIVKRGFKFNLNGNEYKSHSHNALKDSLYRGLTYSALQEYLANNDRSSMRFSIETRVPFLDYRIISRAFALEVEDYISNGTTKIPLRNITERLLPIEISSRKDKMGFISPQEIWQKNDLKSTLDNVFNELLERKLLSFLDYDDLAKIYNEYHKGKYTDWTFIWRVFCLHKYIDVWGLKVNNSFSDL